MPEALAVQLLERQRPERALPHRGQADSAGEYKRAQAVAMAAMAGADVAIGFYERWAAKRIGVCEVPGRMAGSWQVDILKSHRHELKSDMLGVPSGAGSVAPDALFNQVPSSLGFTEVTEVTEVAGGIETRPRNVAYPGGIKLI